MSKIKYLGKIYTEQFGSTDYPYGKLVIPASMVSEDGLYQIVYTFNNPTVNVGTTSSYGRNVASIIFYKKDGVYKSDMFMSKVGENPTFSTYNNISKESDVIITGLSGIRLYNNCEYLVYRTSLVWG